MSKIPARLLAIFFLLLAGSIWIVSRLFRWLNDLTRYFQRMFYHRRYNFGFFQAFPRSSSSVRPNTNKQPGRKAISGWQLGIVSIAVVALVLSIILCFYSY